MAEPKSVNLARVFGSVARELAANRDQLNQADTYNHNHGDNMVDIFGTISEAAKTKKNAEASEQLAYAAELLGQRSNSGSAQLYQEGLVKASQQFRGQQVDSRNLTTLISTLMGAEQTPKPTPQSGSGNLLGALLGGQQTTQPKPQAKPQSKPQTSSGDLLGALLAGQQTTQPKPQAKPQSKPQADSGDLLGALLGGMTGSGSQQTPPQSGSGDLLGALLGGMTGSSSHQTSPQSGTGDLLGSLLGGMTGGSPQTSSQSGTGDLLGSLLGGLTGGSSQSPQSSQGGLDAADLLTAASAYMKAKKRGQSTVEALLNAFIAQPGCPILRIGSSHPKLCSTHS